MTQATLRKPMLVKMGSTTLEQITLEITNVQSTMIEFSYTTLDGNSPSDNGNTAYLWEASSIPWNQTPLAFQSISSDKPNGSIIFSNLNIQAKSYIIGYSLKGFPTNVCSTATVPSGAGPSYTYFSTSVQLLGAPQTDSLVISYSTPAGNAPKSYYDWIGLWEGEAAGFQTDASPLKYIPLSTDSAVGNEAMNDIELSRGTTYTIGYFRGGYFVPPAPKRGGYGTAPVKPTALDKTTMASTFQFSIDP